ncbi:MAG: hypothetical protein JRE23_02825 [Deltaproteobacteria bacterium]|nr:hypothetical protein [Deltaproteobacteria bacterium]
MFNFLRPRVSNEQVKEVIEPMLSEMEQSVNWLQSMQKLDVKDGDIVVLRYGGKLSDVGRINIKNAVRGTIKDYGYDVKVMVLEDGMEIGTLSREA